MERSMGDQHEAQADGVPSLETSAGLDWYQIGREDKAQGRHEPPADATDRVTYEAGQDSLKDITP